MPSLVETAISENQSPDDIARAAARDAASAAANDAQKEALALALYKEATGRFPQDSRDRRAVFIGGYVLVAVVFIVLIVPVVVLQLNDKTLSSSITTLATALISAVLGGLFGYAKQ